FLGSVERCRAVLDALRGDVIPVLLVGNASGEASPLRGEILLGFRAGEDLDRLPRFFRVRARRRDAEPRAGADGDAAGRPNRQWREPDLELDRALEVDELPGAVNDHGYVAGSVAAAADIAHLHAAARGEHRCDLLLADEVDIGLHRRSEF